MRLGKYIFESNSSGFLMRVYRFGVGYIVAKRSIFGNGEEDVSWTIIMEMTQNRQVFFYYSWKRAVEAARFAR